MTTSKRTVRIALLLCDTPVPAVLEETGTCTSAAPDSSPIRPASDHPDLEVFREWLRGCLESFPDRSIPDGIELMVDGYDVVAAGEYPPDSKLQAGGEGSYDVVMLTGSRHTAYDTENPFIPPLIEFTKKIGTRSEYQHIKLVGICFGHQIISIAMGGQCEAGKEGWEIGVYGNEVTEEGKRWWGDVSGQGRDDRVFVQQMHKDVVPSLPPDFHLLLRSEKYPVHSMVHYHPSSTQSNELARIFTIQGHPEFTPSIVSHIIDARVEAGVFKGQEAEEARRRMGGKDGSGGEGLGRLGWAIWRVMLQDLPSA